MNKLSTYKPTSQCTTKFSMYRFKWTKAQSLWGSTEYRSHIWRHFRLYERTETYPTLTACQKSNFSIKICSKKI